MINRKIKKVVLSLIGISFSLFLVYIAFYMYVEFKGYPWEHLKLKGEAIKYMDTKYNMKVKVVRTSFNFKFDSYSVKVYNINDKNKTLINVETGYSNEGLRDNYSMVYWQKKLTDELAEEYSSFYNFSDVKEVKLDFAFETHPIGEGVSSSIDINKVYIPLKPSLNVVMDVDLKTETFSEEFLKKLIELIGALRESENNFDLFITGKPQESTSNSSKERTKLIKLEYNKLNTISTIDDLKKIISDF